MKDTIPWWDFIRSHGSRVWCCDFFTVETAFLQTYYVFFIVDIRSRAIKHFSITQSANRIWLKNTLRLYFSHLQEPPPAILITDNGSTFGKWLGPFLQDYFNIKRIRTPIYSPLCNIYAERMVRTFRQELTDRMIFFGRKDLHHGLSEYVKYYNYQRSHYSLDFSAPQKTFQANSRVIDGKITKKKMLGGLITSFSKAA